MVNTDAPAALRDRVWQALERVFDPEIPVLTVVDLGIVRAVNVVGEDIEVVVTPTYSGCPATQAIHESIRRALADAGFPMARVRTSLQPAWTTDWMTAAGREKLRRSGIAPPTREGAQATIYFRRVEPVVIPCPQCGSTNSERLAEFGSTPCKALYRCRDCREPFDYFKPI